MGFSRRSLAVAGTIPIVALVLVAVSSGSAHARANAPPVVICPEATVSGDATASPFGLQVDDQGFVHKPVYYPQGITTFSPAQVVVPRSPATDAISWPGQRRLTLHASDYLNRFYTT